jgi:hypothetical protein
MRSFKLKILFSVIAALFLAVSAFSQTTFSDSNVSYTFDLPTAAWKMTVKPSQISPNVEYVYVDKADGHLAIRKITIKKDEMLSETIENEEAGLQFQMGYVRGKEEPFEGKLKGKVFNYEFVSASRNMSGRIYYLKADETTVYALRFTGERDKLRTIRNETDSVARTFAVKVKTSPEPAKP